LVWFIVSISGGEVMQTMTANYDSGLITALLKRLRRQRLPRLFAIEDKVEKGQCLSDGELVYLLNAIQDSKQIIPLFLRNPEFQEPQIKLCLLYEQITKLALNNEAAKKATPVEDNNFKQALPV
jgi:hypothetical protein